MVALSSEQAGLNRRDKSKLWVATRNADLCRLFFAVMLAYADSSSLARRVIYEQAKKDLCKRYSMSSRAFNAVIRRENLRRERLGMATVKTERLWGGFKPGAREKRWPRTETAQTAGEDLASRPHQKLCR